MTRAPEGFGARLKAEREHRGLALSQIADSTKIPVPLLEALERDDLTRWPKGLYRRAFFRAYISALGLGPEPLAAEFAQRFPDEVALRPPAPVGDPMPPVADERRTPLPLTFATPRDRRYLVARHVAVAVVELAMIVAAGSLVAVAAGTTVLTASGWVGLLYYPTMSAIRGLQWPSRRRSPKGIRLESWPGRLSRVWAPLRGPSIHAYGHVLAHTRSARARAGASWAAAGGLAVRQFGRMAGAASACLDLLLLNRANRQ